MCKYRIALRAYIGMAGHAAAPSHLPGKGWRGVPAAKAKVSAWLPATGMQSTVSRLRIDDFRAKREFFGQIVGFHVCEIRTLKYL